jgi:hypothetical protein
MYSQSHKRHSDESRLQAPAQTPIQSAQSSTSPALPETPGLPASIAQRAPGQSFTPSTSHIFHVPPSPRSALSDSLRSKAAKVAIPRLQRATETASNSARPSGRHRVNHACEPCRQRKTKCSGERPTCSHCHDFKIACFYADGKRDRARKYGLP